MRLIATSDLHYNIARSRGPSEELAARLCGPPSPFGSDDALVLVGDIAGAEKDRFEHCLALFAAFPGRKFFVAGNHSLWTMTGQDALDLLRRELPARGRRHGFGCLEFEPAILGPVGLAGTVGWYDYSFRNHDLAVPLRFYERKVAPGAARYFREHRDLLARQDDLTDRHHQLTSRWMDGAYVRLPSRAALAAMSEQEFSAPVQPVQAGDTISAHAPPPALPFRETVKPEAKDQVGAAPQHGAEEQSDRQESRGQTDSADQPATDEEFTRMLADKLARQLDELARRVDRIVVVIHHVPFTNLMPELPGEQWQFVAAFMGSELFGQVCLAQPKVSHVICGHTHQPARARNGQIDCHSIGSNYVNKRTVELEF